MGNRTLPSDVVRVASRLFEGLDTPISLGLYLRVKYREWEQILDVSPDPRNYQTWDHSRYTKDAIAAGFLRKLEDLPTSKEGRILAAKAKWYEGESDCFWTNRRLSPYLHENLETGNPREQDVRRFISDVRKVIERWIGAAPPTLIDGRFGPGATYVDKGAFTTVPDKMSSDPALTPGAKYYLLEWRGLAWRDACVSLQKTPTFVPGNRFATVPKTAKTDRSIAVEPSINVFFQLGLGRVLKERLKKNAHWDLKIAPTLHRLIAESSSVSREFATLDLSNASDTVAYNLVRLLLPRRWLHALEDLRSPKTLIDGRWVMLEKFSSMGNGFTFELETLIFAALAVVTSRKAGHKGWLGRDVFVFGDDIIVKDDVAHPLKLVLEFFGFRLNKEKSYSGGTPFRESCGGDYFNGFSTRPYFLKELPNGPQDYISLANGLRAAATQLAPLGASGCIAAWFTALDSIPTRVRDCRGPQDLGDIVIHDDPERWTVRWRAGIRYLKVFRPWRLRKVAFGNFHPSVVLACATYGTGNIGTPVKGVVPRTEGVTPRDAVLSYKEIGRAHV